MIKMNIPQQLRRLLGLPDPLFIERVIASSLQKIGLIHLCFPVPDYINLPHTLSLLFITLTCRDLMQQL